MGEWFVSKYDDKYDILERDGDEVTMVACGIPHGHQAQYVCDTVNKLCDALHRCRSSSYLP